MPGEAAGEVGSRCGDAALERRGGGPDRGARDRRAARRRHSGLSLPVPVGVVAAFAAWNFPACWRRASSAPRSPRAARSYSRRPRRRRARPPRSCGAIAEAGRSAGRRESRLRGSGAGVRAPDRRPRGAARSRFTGSTAVGPASSPRLAARGPKRCRARARRPRAGDRLRGRRRGARGRRDAGGEVRLRRSVVRRAQPLPRASRALRRVRRAVHRRGGRAAGRRADEAGAQLGPVIGARRLEALQRLTADAVAAAARILRCGGERLGRRRVLLGRRRCSPTCRRRRGRHARGAVRADRRARARSTSSTRRSSAPTSTDTRSRHTCSPTRCARAPARQRSAGDEHRHQPDGAFDAGRAARRHAGQRLRLRGRAATASTRSSISA